MPRPKTWVAENVDIHRLMFSPEVVSIVYTFKSRTGETLKVQPGRISFRGTLPPGVQEAYITLENWASRQALKKEGMEDEV